MNYSDKNRKLIAFFSVDISNSTDYKVKNANYESFDRHWARFYESFFPDFQAKFMGSLSEKAEKTSAIDPSKLKIWKLLGDEILFFWNITSPEDMMLVARAFYEAFVEYDAEIRGKHQLRVKATAWVAGFPIRNTEIKVAGKGNGIDFIGPDIDAGFRLSSVTRPGRMAISMDMADVLASVSCPENFDFYHVGWARLKGVYAGNPYPVIWISTRPPTMVEPWEDYDCDFSKAFHTTGSKISAKELMIKIAEIRSALPALRLFKPYVKRDEMPQFHKEIWLKWQQDRKMAETYETGGDSLGTDSQ